MQIISPSLMQSKRIWIEERVKARVTDGVKVSRGGVSCLPNHSHIRDMGLTCNADLLVTLM